MRISERISSLSHHFKMDSRCRSKIRHRRRHLLVEKMEDRRLMAVIDLATLTASQGTTIFGAETLDQSGYSVSSAGDVNGDGFDDLLIGAYLADASGNAKLDAGESYVIFGAASLPATIDLANLGAAGITIFGADAYDYSGRSVSSAGDVNGDGFDDLVIGARFAQASGNAKIYAGDSYVIFGKVNWSTTPTINLANLSTLGPTVGITIFGADPFDQSGQSVSSAGDVNGDGFDDLLIGAIEAAASGNAKTYAGESYVIFGAASLPATIDLANLGTLGPTVGITIFGADGGDRSGGSVSSAGDVNGDGFDDLLIGAYQADASGNAKSDAGDSYVIFGAASLPATIDLANLGSTGITIFGADGGDRSGGSVSSAGDVNGDGFDDLIIGAYRADASGNAKSDAGESYLIFGAASLPTTIDLASLGSAGITIFGADSDDRSGISVSSAGDVNGDGFDDLLIGAYGAAASGNAKSLAGESYVIFGKANWSTTPTIDLNTLGSTGITLFGTDANDQSGSSVTSAGDVNGDGFDDLLIGAIFADASGNAKSLAGESYMIFGGNGFTNSILPANLGTNVANTINGAAGAQILNGADGDDTLAGGGGADVLLGGRGNDVLAVSDLSFQRIVGGNGSDTLWLDGSGLNLDVTSIPDNRIVDIETLDIIGSGNNTLTLNHREVLNLSSTTNTLIVRRNAGDVVNMGSGWTLVGSETIGLDSFQVYSQGQAQLKVQAVAQASVAGRQVFYNNSSGFGTSGANNAPTVNPINAIDSTKQALLPGIQTTTTANFTNYSRGLNGIVVDLNSPSNLAGITAASFQFAVWNSFPDATPNFVTITPAVTVSTFASGGSAGSDRVKLVFADRAIENAWLRITVLADANTGLAANDVFYFGNARFEVTPTSPFPASQIVINAFDVNFLRSRQGQDPGVVSHISDVDRNGVVNAFDINAARAGAGVASLRSFTAPSNISMSFSLSRIDSAFADTSWLESFQTSDTKKRQSRRI
jgi:FG-GAP repeat/RTX calcium-binding nonapeptide repeat (4 copies)